MFYIHYIIVLTLLMCRSTPAEGNGRSCIGLKSKPGTCVEIRKCEPIKKLVGQSVRNIKMIERASAQCNLTQQEVCCPTPGLELPSFEDGCGLLSKPRSITKRIVGGTEAKIGTWPWIALLGYESDGKIQFSCGGSIITRRHILAAGHCITSSLSIVRLGEHDLTTDAETTHVDIKVRKALKHPSFSKTSHALRSNIGLLYLEQDIQFTDKIKPICLPITLKLRRRTYERFTPFVAGWGVSSTRSLGISNVLMQVQVQVYNNQVCDDVFRRLELLSDNERIDDAFLCAGDIEGLKDACQGDSGNPLLIAERVGSYYHLVLIGIVSSGFGCGEGPGLYTNTSYYMDWIEENIRESV